MAPRAKITEEELGPSTLPADFGEWDSGAPPTTLPDNFNDFDAAPKLPQKPVAAKPTVSRAAGRMPDNTASRAQATAYADTEELSEPPQSKRLKVAAGPKRRAEAPVEDEDQGESKGKSKVLFGAIGGVLVLALIVLISLNYHKSAPKTALPNQSTVQQPTTMSQTQTETAATTATKPAAATAATAATTDTPTAPVTAAPAVQSDMMDKQLSAPSRISSNIKTTPDKDVAPTSGFGATGMEGLGGGSVNSGVFNSKTGPKVAGEASNKTLNVSGGVMAGRSISKTPPVYPRLARTAHVEGTVVLHANVSRTGTITNLSVISGPTMLRQAALDAVKTWRYRPYLLDNQPVEVETTVNVTFVLGE